MTRGLVRPTYAATMSFAVAGAGFLLLGSRGRLADVRHGDPRVGGVTPAGVLARFDPIAPDE